MSGMFMASIRVASGTLEAKALEASRTPRRWVEYLAEENLRRATGLNAIPVGGVISTLAGKTVRFMEIPTEAPWPVTVALVQELCKAHKARMAALCMTSMMVSKEVFNGPPVAIDKLKGTPLLVVYAENRRGTVACKRMEIVKGKDGTISGFLERGKLTRKEILGFRPIRFFEGKK